MRIENLIYQIIWKYEFNPRSAFFVSAADSNTGMMQIRDFLDNGEPQSAATALAARNTVKTFKDFVYLVVGDARPIILHD